MKILYFSRNYSVHDRRFLGELSKHYEVSFLRLHENAFPYTQALPPSVRQISKALSAKNIDSPEECLPLMPEYRKIIDEIKPDIIHAGPIQTCAFMTALSGFKPFLAASWGYDILKDSTSSSDFMLATKMVLEKASAFLCDCDEVRKKALGFAAIKTDSIVQFPWGIDLKRFSPAPPKYISEIRKKLGWENNFVLISLRSWEKIYGITTALEAFKTLRIRLPDAKLLMLGRGSMAKELEDFISCNSLRDCVHCPGSVQNEVLPEYLRAADVYISCSGTDGSSISLIEAMACGLMPVVSDIPGNSEWICGNGVLCPVQNSNAFADALFSYAAAEKKEKERLSALNRRIALEKADWNENVKKLFSAYEKLYFNKSGGNK